MAQLAEHVQEFIVKELARYRGYADTARRVLEVFKVEITRFQVRYYDPTTRDAKPLAKKWVDLHAATREEYRSKLDHVAITSPGGRAEALQRALDLAFQRKQLALVVQILDRGERIFGDRPPPTADGDDEGGGGDQLPDPSTEPIDYVERVIGRDLAAAPKTAGPFGKRT